jgi:hypothetical protein
MQAAQFTRRWLVASSFAIAIAQGGDAIGQDITSNLRGHWRLTETSGTNAADASATPHNGTYINGPLLANSTPNPIDGAVSANFDGVDDYVVIGTESWFDITGAITVAAWIKVDVWDAQWQTIVSKGDTSWRISRNSTNNGVVFACNGLSTHSITSSKAMNDGKWHHVCGVWNPSQGIMYLFIDGVVDNYISNWGTISTNNFNVEIARNAEIAGREFDGAIYDVRVYNRALDLGDVAYLALKTAPVGYWRFNHTSGTTVTDYSIFGSNGTVANGAPWTSRCNVAKALDLNGSTQYVTVNNANQLLPIWSLTIAGWIKADSWGAGADVDAIIRKGDTTPNNYALGIADGRVELLLDANDSAGIKGNTVLTTGEWHHVAATWDGAYVRIYVDGVLDNTPAPRTGNTNYDTRPMYIGGRPGDDCLDGQIQEVYLYNRALNAAEIAVLAGKSGTWKFSEGTGTAAADTSGVGNNATLASGATWVTDCAGNKALQTNGSTGVAQTSSSFTPPATGAVAFWMKPAAGSTLRRIFGNGSNWEVRQQSDNSLVFDLGADGATIVSTVEPLDDTNHWYHVAACYNADDEGYEIYVDGELVNAGTNANNVTQQAAGVLSFGTRTGSTQYWQGALRDFRVYSRELCPAEVSDLAGLAAHWAFDEAAGSTANDASGWARNGAVTGAPAWVAGAIDNCLQLNGSTKVTASSLIGSPKNVTMSVWANLTSADTSGAEVISLGDHFAIRLNDGGSSRCFFYNGSTWLSATTNQTFAGAGWKHFAAVFDDDNNVMKFYVNGVEAASLSTTASIVWTGLASNMVLGSHANGVTTVDFTGKIDDARVYSRALCPAEVLELYNGSNPPGVRMLQWVEVR